MKSYTTLSALLVAASSMQLCAAYGSTYTFQGFSGNTCDGDAGNVVDFPDPSGDTKYIDFTNRHSFRVTLSNGNYGGEYLAYATACVTEDCKDGLTDYVWEIDEAGCSNVNTGGAVNGFALFTTYGGI
ncbi:hypothetical protein UA08_03890 [Talaromyces atroroseus]|uniref:AA1-like domain-containing protein n=1 Tax=Talaromyces atroroseus TaxID=1441469 RepID=A0A225AST1_TALAT|nr:hypothetical protein UA08_03890 [Talaromyces atroroseus]OKL61404.1 hypothetical protein UA08_03890 [Talaromyces atroroseus]